jgi:hypothetical protein
MREQRAFQSHEESPEVAFDTGTKRYEWLNDSFLTGLLLDPARDA